MSKNEELKAMARSTFTMVDGKLLSQGGARKALSEQEQAKANREEIRRIAAASGKRLYPETK